MSNILPLQFLRSGQTAHVFQLLGADGQLQRLRELGLHDGTAIQMVRQGSPCIIRLAHKKLCLRADEQTSVLVQAEG